MIQALIGTLVAATANSAILRCNDSIEFELLVSSQSASRLSNLNKEERQSVRLLTYLQHRDDAMTLYGFIDEEERRLFLELNKVTGIGPRQALRILGSVQVRAFVQALDQGDVKFLSSIPGIGAKTANKIILALRNTIVLDEDLPSAKPTVALQRYNDLIVALADMGYDKRQVVAAVTKLLEENEQLLQEKRQHEAEEFLFRQAIIELG